MATLIDILIGLSLVGFLTILYHYSWHKIKEWANDPKNEYKMQYPIDDDYKQSKQKRNIKE